MCFGELSLAFAARILGSEEAHALLFAYALNGHSMVES
jgi:hypothetical protein